MEQQKRFVKNTAGHSNGEGYMGKVKKVISIIAVLAVACVYAHIAKANPIYDKKVDNSEYLSTGVVWEGLMEQKFVCVEDTLDGVKVKVQVIGDVRNVQIRYRLTDNQLGKSVAEGKLEAKDIKPGKFCDFPFDTIRDARGKEYTVIFENVNANEDNGIGIFFQPMTQKGTELLISGNRTEGTFILKTITNRFDFETFAMFLISIVYITSFMKLLYKLFE